VDIHITNSYPFEPPKMKFLTKVWHPNVSSQSGAICLDVLKDQWTPALTIKTALLSVQALLAAAEPDDPQDAVVAKMYVSNRAQFDLQAKEWTEKYAKEGQKVEAAKDPKVVKLMEMGFGEQDAERALVKCNFNQEEALEYLLAQ
jgi:ubiquitin-conjugating enzyme (huntingtin interacting protein 2)